MIRKAIRAYADTSVYGGVFDEEFAEPSRKFFEQVRKGYCRLVISDLVRDELKNAPELIRNLAFDMEEFCEEAVISEEAIELQEEYIKAGIVAPRWESDALHVALATVSRCSILVSWNFKHIVNYKKIAEYNAINVFNQYGSISIYSPQEMGDYDEDENV